MNPIKEAMTKTAFHGTATGTIRLNKILGITVEYDPDFLLIADSSGLGPFKRITVGPQFLALNARQKGAVLLHEAGHCKHRHIERLALHVLCRPRLFWAILCAAFLASRRFEIHGAEAKLWFEAEVERRAPGVGALRRTQEFQADRFAARCGYGLELAQVFQLAGSEGTFHPGVEERIRELVKTPRMEGI